MKKKFLDKFLDKIIRQIRFGKILKHIKADSVVCDIGCGRDFLFLEQIKNKVKKGIGIDSYLDENFNHGNIELIKQDVQSILPIQSNSVDIITLMALIEHLENPDLMLDEIFRILKPGGFLLLTTPAPISKPLLEFMAYKLKVIDEKEIRDHKKYYSGKNLKRILECHNFDKDKIEIKYFELGLNIFVKAYK